eukprot:403347985
MIFDQLGQSGIRKVVSDLFYKIEKDPELYFIYNAQTQQKYQEIIENYINNQDAFGDKNPIKFTVDKLGINTQKQIEQYDKIAVLLGNSQSQLSAEGRKKLISILKSMSIPIANQQSVGFAGQGVPFYFGMPMRSIFGGGMGYIAGALAKEMSKKIMMYSCFGFMTFYMLSKFDYITINWKKIDHDVFYLVFKTNSSESGFVKFIKRTFTHVLPLISGFGAGFYFAWKNT